MYTHHEFRGVEVNKLRVVVLLVSVLMLSAFFTSSAAAEDSKLYSLVKSFNAAVFGFTGAQTYGYGSTAEVCGDGIDNDKDGYVDEGCTSETGWATTASACVDSDGQDEYVQGTVTKYSRPYKDYCLSGRVYEYYCKDDDSVGLSIKTCPQGCAEGYCLADENAAISKDGEFVLSGQHRLKYLSSVNNYRLALFRDVNTLNGISVQTASDGSGTINIGGKPYAFKPVKLGTGFNYDINVDLNGDGVIGTGSAEVCGDGIDNDKDGYVDEGCMHESCQKLLDKAKAASGTSCGDAGYDYSADVNNDRSVNAVDITLIESKAADANWCVTNYLAPTDPCTASDADLSITSFSGGSKISGSNVYYTALSTQTSFSATVKNSGPAPATGYGFSFSCGGGSGGAGGGVSDNYNFPPGAERTESSTCYYPASGSYTASIKVSASNDQNAANDVAYQNIIAAVADESAAIKRNDYFVLSGGLYLLRYLGADRISSYNPAAKFQNVATGETITVAAGSVGGTVRLGGSSYAFTSSSSPTSNDYSIKVDLNADGRIGATTGAPDIYVATLTYDPLSPKVGDNVTFNADIKNIGNGGATGYSTGHSIDCPTSASRGVGVSSGLGPAPGETESFTFTHTFSAADTCTVTVSASADGDSNAANNKRSVTVTIIKGPLRPPCGTYGDVNGDGVVDVADSQLVLQAAVGSRILTAAQTAAADLDKSGRVSAADSSIILQYLSGQISTFPVCGVPPDSSTLNGDGGLPAAQTVCPAKIEFTIDKDVYRHGDKLTVYIATSDSQGKLVGADLVFSVVKPDGKFSSDEITTKPYGEHLSSQLVSSDTPVGNYAFTVKSHPLCAQIVTAEKTIRVEGSTSTVPPEPPGQACTDSDGGANYYKKGYVTVCTIGDQFGSCGQITDRCADETLLNEQICDGDGSTNTLVDFACPDGCSDGACIRGSPPPFPGPGDTVTGTFFLDKGWNLVGGFFAEGAGVVIERNSCTSDVIEAAYIYDPVSRTYLSETSKIPGSINEYLIVDKVNSIWVKTNSRCSFDYTINEPYGWLQDVQNSGKKLADGWNLLSVVPDMVGFTVDEFAGTCSVEKAYGYKGGRWEDIRTTELAETAIGYGFAFKVNGECVIGPPTPTSDVGDNSATIPPGSGSGGGGGGSGGVGKVSPCSGFGDVDGDGVVSVVDSDLISKFVSKLVTLSADQKLRADVNGNGVVAVNDALFVRQFVEGLRDSFAVCPAAAPGGGGSAAKVATLRVGETDVYAVAGRIYDVEVVDVNSNSVAFVVQQEWVPFAKEKGYYELASVAKDGSHRLSDGGKLEVLSISGDYVQFSLSVTEFNRGQGPFRVHYVEPYPIVTCKASDVNCRFNTVVHVENVIDRPLHRPTVHTPDKSTVTFGESNPLTSATTEFDAFGLPSQEEYGGNPGNFILSSFIVDFVPPSRTPGLYVGTVNFDAYDCNDDLRIEGCVAYGATPFNVGIRIVPD
ncbi:hypothetical protein HYX10_02235 [Candidatus Woesearchaeota archaeon]|nr:hypothetical protein [Candidatus Woesearchaeota archaeon]